MFVFRQTVDAFDATHWLSADVVCTDLSILMLSYIQPGLLLTGTSSVLPGLPAEKRPRV